MLRSQCCLRISLRRQVNICTGLKEPVRILMLTSGPGLNRSQISDWVTALSLSQTGPAEMGVVMVVAGSGD